MKNIIARPKTGNNKIILLKKKKKKDYRLLENSSQQKSPSQGNQSIDQHCKSVDWLVSNANNN